MSLTLGTVVTAARDRHPAFHKSRVSDAIFARLLTAYQSELIGRAMQRNRVFLAQQMSIVLAPNGSNAIGTRGAGVGQFPVTVATDGTVSQSDATVGAADELVLDDGTTTVSAFVPSSSTTTTAVKTGAGWTTNAYAGQVVEVTTGTGAGQRRYVASNTSDTLTWTDALTTALDASSVIRVVSVATSTSEEVGVVTAFPLTTSRYGYTVKLDSAGTAYLDLTSPVVATVDQGIPLPTMKHLIGGTVRFVEDPNNEDPRPFTLITYANRFHTAGSWWSGYVLNNTLYLTGTQDDWADIASIDLRYVPEPPSFTRLTDYVLLPDYSQPALVAHLTYMAGLRVAGLEGLPPLDLGALATAKSQAETAFLQTVSAQPRATVSRIQDRW